MWRISKTNGGEPIDYSFHPFDYDSTWNLLHAFASSIQGQARREVVLKLVNEGRVDEIDGFLLQEQLTEDQRQDWGRIHPLLMGGEFLPKARRGEVEIARISLMSVMGDVISIRARRTHSGWNYRVVDEYMDTRDEDEIEISPSHTVEPLTLGELINLINSLEDDPLYDYTDRPYGDRVGPLVAILDHNLSMREDEITKMCSELPTWRESARVGTIWYLMYGKFGPDGPGPDPLSRAQVREVITDFIDGELGGFITASSKFYPQLKAYYDALVDRWISDRAKKIMAKAFIDSRGGAQKRSTPKPDGRPRLHQLAALSGSTVYPEDHPIYDQGWMITTSNIKSPSRIRSEAEESKKTTPDNSMSGEQDDSMLPAARRLEKFLKTQSQSTSSTTPKPRARKSAETSPGPANPPENPVDSPGPDDSSDDMVVRTLKKSLPRKKPGKRSSPPE